MRRRKSNHRLGAALCATAVLWLCLGGHAFADKVTFWNGSTYSTSGTDDMFLGMMRWYDGENYVMAYDARNASNCVAYFALHQGDVMQGGLRGSVPRVELGAGNDRFEVIGGGTSYTVGGTGASFCANLPRLSSLNYNGQTLIINGQSGRDRLDTADANGNTWLAGESGDDVLVHAYAGLATLVGGHDDDELWGSRYGTNMNGSAGRDMMVGIGARNDLFSGGTESDCAIVDMSRGTPSYVDCGAHTDSYYADGYTLSSSTSCERRVSFTTCFNW